MKSILAVALFAAAVARAEEAAVDAGTAAPLPAVADAAPPAAAPADVPWWKHFEPFGYAKVGVFYTLPTRDEQIPGGNGGFRMVALRLGTTYKPVDSLEVAASLEGAWPQPTALDPSSGSKIVVVRDAYVAYEICKCVVVTAGQFKAPFWGEMLLGDSQLPFATRSVISEGYSAPEYAGTREPLALDRQLGVQLSSRRLGGPSLGFKYAVGVFNGNGPNQLFNDNNSVMPVGRVELELFEHVTLAANAYYNQRTDGVRPNRLTSNHFGYGGDISAHAVGFNILVGFVGRSTTYDALPADSALGILGQLSYLHEGTGLGGGVRFTLFDPSAADPNDDVNELTLMLSYQLKKAPLRILLQFTHRTEATGVSVANDDLDAMMQVAW